jgi:hypothetical protein
VASNGLPEALLLVQTHALTAVCNRVGCLSLSPLFRTCDLVLSTSVAAASDPPFCGGLRYLRDAQGLTNDASSSLSQGTPAASSLKVPSQLSPPTERVGSSASFPQAVMPTTLYLKLTDFVKERRQPLCCVLAGVRRNLRNSNVLGTQPLKVIPSRTRLPPCTALLRLPRPLHFGGRLLVGPEHSCLKISLPWRV